MADASQRLSVLLVEDNPADVYLARLFLRRCSAAIDLEVAEDGAAALELLGLEGNGHKVLPQIILLDLNLPKVDGWVLLRRLKAHAELRRIPVVVLSSARSESEIERCYELQASAFVSKLDEPKSMENQFRELARFWFQSARLPPW
jgi:CheY-like chemotaxis protein